MIKYGILIEIKIIVIIRILCGLMIRKNYSLRNDIIKLNDIERKQEYIPYIT